jgi:peptidoglycan LD-endopeptidase LytH
VNRRLRFNPFADDVPARQRLMATLTVVAVVAGGWWTYGSAWREAPRAQSADAIVAAAPSQSQASVITELQARHLELPVQGVDRSQLVPSFDQQRGNHPHEAIDILAPRGTPVVAVEDGTIAKLFPSKPGGLTIYLFDASARFAYYYAHLDRYAEELTEGQRVARGQVLGYVGSTGNADPASPHLHFSIFRLGPERHWWEGEAIDPYPVFHGPSEPGR